MLVSLSLMPTPIAEMTPALRSSSSARKPESITVLKRSSRMRAVLDRPEVDVVDQRNVDLVEAEPQVRVLERAHHAVIGVVELRHEARQAVLTEIFGQNLTWLARMQDAANLGRARSCRARLLAQRRARAQLAAAVAH